VSTLPRFQGISNFSKNKSAAKSLILYATSREAAEKLVAACDGYDVPPYVKFNDFKTWDEVGPPKGTISHYPNKGDQVPIIPFAPAKATATTEIYTQAVASKMVVRMVKGEPMAQTLDWASREIEGPQLNPAARCQRRLAPLRGAAIAPNSGRALVAPALSCPGAL
jgi:hypothetical protein